MTLPTIVSRLPEVGASIFAVMSHMAGEAGAINLSQGFPDFDVPAPLVDLVTKAMHDGRNQYAPMPGDPVLRDVIARTIGATYGIAVDPGSDITVTAGATEAIFSAVCALVGPGDEAILFDPAYDAYDPAIRLAGGVPVH
ncbi:MAG TPA: aminotransferase class I/II-fold pyridoxal phosphate-dependent enzyme, partial [Candidatus Deferrimicrobiaceae bacterium]